MAVATIWRPSRHQRKCQHGLPLTSTQGSLQGGRVQPLSKEKQETSTAETDDSTISWATRKIKSTTTHIMRFQQHMGKEYHCNKSQKVHRDNMSNYYPNNILGRKITAKSYRRATEARKNVPTIF